MSHIAHLSKLADVVRYHIAKDTPLDMSVFWHPCGTMGCVAGWAAQEQYFQDLGLVLVPGTYAGNRQGNLLLRRKPKVLAAFDALKALFELDDYQAAYIFGNNALITGEDQHGDWHDALSHIEDVLRGDV